ncbi:unnamed protein product [Sphenostylis stenocarpa]|uniref:Hydroxyproline-rich glycoprotein family protein n=1 Tax=Sphenostylis stenocarpa TaxID=92480 RepID=A0AA86STH1_9FABA|nr:unnamed protein product [Sphenostylis stenocarpa]
MEIHQDPLHLPPLPPPSEQYFADDHVEQLNTSNPKQATLNTKAPSCADGDGHVSPNRNLKKNGQHQQLKKQIRRRHPTNRPSQEKFLNMAEARREIVTALKYHRATKQASELQQLQHYHQHQSLAFQPSLLSRFSPDERFRSRRRPRMSPPFSTKIANFLHDFSLPSLPPPLPLPPPPPPPPPLPPAVPNSYSNSINSPFAHPPPTAETPNFILPSHSLGLNLNLHTFNSLEPTLLLNDKILDSTLLLNNNILEPTFFLNNDSNYSPPTFSSPPLLTDQDVPSMGISQSQGEGSSSVMNTIESSTTNQASGNMHVAMDEEGMAEIRALGEQHQMEWDDSMSLVTSVWWFNCLQQMEHNAHEVNTEDDRCHEIFDDELEFPIWEN